jgi:aspartate racemase
LAKDKVESCGKVRTFGLVSGLGVGAGMFYYKALVDAHLARSVSPHLLLVHADAGHVMSLAAARKSMELAEYLAGLLKQLALGGAEIATIPAFSPQVCMKELASLTPLPLISLLDAIAAEVEQRRYRRVALLGARVTMETHMFGALQDIDVILPRPEELDTIAEIYLRVVQEARASKDEFERLRVIAHSLLDRERLDAIILAGTDLAFVFNPSNTDFPHVDGARVHLQAIMRAIAAPPETSAVGAQVSV